jgi:hypothetical protein
VKYVVFSQSEVARVDPAAVCQQAVRYFEARIEFEPAPPGESEEKAVPSTRVGAFVLLRLQSVRHGYQATCRVGARSTQPTDLEAAVRAEEKSRAYGMSALASRCPTLLVVEPEPGAEEAGVLNLCAILASLSLGPILPKDRSALFGVRGAMERVERLVQAR